MAVILITFSSLRLNLINSANGHSKSHSFYFPKESVPWNPPLIFNESDDSGAPGHGWDARKTHYVTPSVKTYKQKQSFKLKGHLCLQAYKLSTAKHKMLSKDKFIVSE